jgi:hypothetical protein
MLYSKIVLMVILIVSYIKISKNVNFHSFVIKPYSFLLVYIIQAGMMKIQLIIK